MGERVTEAGSSEALIQQLNIAIPNTIYSLSYVALPFPMNDGLYGIVAARGEQGALIVSLDTLQRMSANPFFPYLLERIEEGIRPLGASETLRRQLAAEV